MTIRLGPRKIVKINESEEPVLSPKESVRIFSSPTKPEKNLMGLV